MKSEVLERLLAKFSPGFIIALVLIGVGAYLWVTTGNIPDSLYALLAAVIGFYFGEATGVRMERVRNNNARVKEG